MLNNNVISSHNVEYESKPVLDTLHDVITGFVSTACTLRVKAVVEVTTATASAMDGPFGFPWDFQADGDSYDDIVAARRVTDLTTTTAKRNEDRPVEYCTNLLEYLHTVRIFQRGVNLRWQLLDRALRGIGTVDGGLSSGDGRSGGEEWLRQQRGDYSSAQFPAYVGIAWARRIRRTILDTGLLSSAVGDGATNRTAGTMHALMSSMRRTIEEVYRLSWGVVARHQPASVVPVALLAVSLMAVSPPPVAGRTPGAATSLPSGEMTAMQYVDQWMHIYLDSILSGAVEIDSVNIQVLQQLCSLLLPCRCQGIRRKGCTDGNNDPLHGSFPCAVAGRTAMAVVWRSWVAWWRTHRRVTTSSKQPIAAAASKEYEWWSHRSGTLTVIQLSHHGGPGRAPAKEEERVVPGVGLLRSVALPRVGEGDDMRQTALSPSLRALLELPSSLSSSVLPCRVHLWKNCEGLTAFPPHHSFHRHHHTHLPRNQSLRVLPRWTGEDGAPTVSEMIDFLANGTGKDGEFTEEVIIFVEQPIPQNVMVAWVSALESPHTGGGHSTDGEGTPRSYNKVSLMGGVGLPFMTKMSQMMRRSVLPSPLFTAGLDVLGEESSSDSDSDSDDDHCQPVKAKCNDGGAAWVSLRELAREDDERHAVRPALMGTEVGVFIVPRSVPRQAPTSPLPPPAAHDIQCEHGDGAYRRDCMECPYSTVLIAGRSSLSVKVESTLFYRALFDATTFFDSVKELMVEGSSSGLPRSSSSAVAAAEGVGYQRVELPQASDDASSIHQIAQVWLGPDGASTFTEHVPELRSNDHCTSGRRQSVMSHETHRQRSLQRISSASDRLWVPGAGFMESVWLHCATAYAGTLRTDDDYDDDDDDAAVLDVTIRQQLASTLAETLSDYLRAVSGTHPHHRGHDDLGDAEYGVMVTSRPSDRSGCPCVGVPPHVDVPEDASESSPDEDDDVFTQGTTNIRTSSTATTTVNVSSAGGNRSRRKAHRFLSRCHRVHADAVEQALRTIMGSKSREGNGEQDNDDDDKMHHNSRQIPMSMFLQGWYGTVVATPPMENWSQRRRTMAPTTALCDVLHWSSWSHKATKCFLQCVPRVVEALLLPVEVSVVAPSSLALPADRWCAQRRATRDRRLPFMDVVIEAS